MTKDEILRRCTTPLTAPAIPRCRHLFRNREHLFILYRTDREALRRAVPEPLEVPEDPLVRFEVMYMPDATGFGCYTECGQAIPVRFRGESGEYLHMMYLDNFEATAAGREVNAYPKKYGHPKLFVDGDVLVGTLDYGESRMRVATATMNYKYYPLPEAEAKAQICAPTYMLKLQPYYDGTPRIAELIRTQTSDVEILEGWTGDARLQLFDHVMAPMNDLPVREIVGAYHILTNLSLGRASMIYNYLEK